MPPPTGPAASSSFARPSGAVSVGIEHRVEASDPAIGTVRLRPDKRPGQHAESKPVDWQPARWGVDLAEVFTEVPQDFRAGDQMQFARNNYRADRLNGQTAKVVAIDSAESNLVLQREDVRREMLDMHYLADRHLRSGRVRTIHSAQGATCDRVLAHLETFRADTVNARSVYVAISRARQGADVYTDSPTNLTKALGIFNGNQVGAIDGIIKLISIEIARLTPSRLSRRLLILSGRLFRIEPILLSISRGSRNWGFSK